MKKLLDNYRPLGPMDAMIAATGLTIVMIIVLLIAY